MLVLLLLCAVFSWTAASRDQLLKGYSNVYEESVDADVIVVRGAVPEWLEGVFMRHSCGAYGNTGSQSEDIDRVTHEFDCIEMGQTFKFQDGRVSFTNRFYDTETVNIYKNQYNMSLIESGVYWTTIFSDFDIEDVERHDNDYATSSLPREVPHVSWWQIGSNVAAYTEYKTGFDIDIHNVETSGPYQYQDVNFGYGYGYIFIDNPAHEHKERDGTVWSATMTYMPEGSTFQQWWLVYTMQNDTRTPFVEIMYNDLDLTLCRGGPYPVDEDRQGYMHSFALTENYVILPETSYLFRPCNTFVYSQNQDPSAFFPGSFEWRGDVPSRMRVIDRRTAQLVATIPTEAFFVTHQLNAYESGEMIYADMLTYENSDIYEYHFLVDSLVNATEPYSTTIERFAINTTDWSLERIPLVPEPAAYEFSNINYAYNTQPYTYAYVLENSYIDFPQSVIKLNVNTGEMQAYDTPEGVYPQEPVFVARPGGSEEDDGVVLTQGLDGRNGTGFVAVLDARDMSELAYISAPGLMLFGVHNKFFALDVGHGQGKTQ